MTVLRSGGPQRPGIRGGVEKWLKSAVMATVTVIWTLYMIVALVRYLFYGEPLPDPAIWGIPGMIWLALHPPIPNLKKQPETDE